MNQTFPMDKVKTITTEKFIVNITQCSIIKIKLIKKVQQTGLHWNFQLTKQLFSKLWRLTWKKVHWERGWEIKQFENMVMTISEILWNKERSLLNSQSPTLTMNNILPTWIAYKLTFNLPWIDDTGRQRNSYWTQIFLFSKTVWFDS